MLKTYTLSQPIGSIKTLYARHFYPKLLRVLRATAKAVLIGNAGTAKSVTQLYVLMQLLKAHDTSTPLPPDCWGSTVPYDVVVRQMGNKYTSVYFLKAGVAHLISSTIGTTDDVLRCFDPKSTMYMYEPLTDRISSPTLVDHPSLVTVSPRPERIKV